MQDTLYYPWGQVWALGSGWADERFSQGQELETFFYPWLKPTNARKYNPNFGRWLSPDPLAGDVTNPQSLNRYAYVLNNPTNLVDPLGLCDDGAISSANGVTTVTVCGGGGGGGDNGP